MTWYGDIIIQVNVPKGYKIFRRYNPAGYLNDRGQCDGYRPYEYYIIQKIPPRMLKLVYELPLEP